MSRPRIIASASGGAEDRNAIHAFKDRPIGDNAEFQTALRSHLVLLREINNRLPYPDDTLYQPREA